MVTEAELGATYTGPVRRVESYGAFVQILPNKDGIGTDGGRRSVLTYTQFST